MPFLFGYVKRKRCRISQAKGRSFTTLTGVCLAVSGAGRCLVAAYFPGVKLCLALLFFILAELFFYIKNYIIVPLRKFKVFLKNFEKSKFIIQDFEQNSDFSKFYDSLSRIFYNIKNLEQDLGFYKNEHELLFESSDLIIIYVNAKDNRIVSCSNAALEFCKYS